MFKNLTEEQLNLKPTQQDKENEVGRLGAGLAACDRVGIPREISTEIVSSAIIAFAVANDFTPGQVAEMTTKMTSILSGLTKKPEVAFAQKAATA